MAQQGEHTSPGAPAAAGNTTAPVTGDVADISAVAVESRAARPGDDASADSSLEGIPREVIEQVGAYDPDIPGGCG